MTAREPEIPDDGIPIRSITIIDWIDGRGKVCTSYATTGDPDERDVVAMLHIAGLLVAEPILRSALGMDE